MTLTFNVSHKQKENDEMVTVASGNTAQADQMKMHLEGHGIPVFLHGELGGTVAPHIASAGGASAVRVQVPRSRVEEAKALLAQIEDV